MLHYRNYPCNPSTFGKIATLSYFPCLSRIWPALIPHMSHWYPETLSYPLPKVVLRLHTRYSINSPTRNHYPNQSGYNWLQTIIQFKQGPSFRTLSVLFPLFFVLFCFCISFLFIFTLITIFLPLSFCGYGLFWALQVFEKESTNQSSFLSFEKYGKNFYRGQSYSVI